MASIISLVNKKEDFNTMEQFFLTDNSNTTTTTNSENDNHVQKDNDPNPSTTYSSDNKVNSTQNPGTTTLSSNPGTTTLSSNPGTTTLSSNPGTTTLSSNNLGTTAPINDNSVPSNCGDIGDPLYSFKDYDAEHTNPEIDFTIHMNDSGKITYKYDEGCTSFDSNYNQCSNNDNDNDLEENDLEENDLEENDLEENDLEENENESIDDDIYINDNKKLSQEQINKVSKYILNNDNDYENDIIDKAIQFIKYVGIILLVLFICLSLYLFLG